MIRREGGYIRLLSAVAVGGLLLSLLLMVPVAIAVLAQTSGGYLNSGELGVGVGVPGGSAPGGSATGGSSGGSGGGGGAAAVPVCTGNSTSDQGNATNETGPERYVRIDPASGLGKALDGGGGGNGAVLAGKPSPDANGTWYSKYCGANGFAGYVWAPQGTPPGPPPPPPPPTAGEMNDRIPLPTPAFGLSPSGAGLTGMATWLWDPTGSAPRSVSATIRGWTATATANPGTWSWTMYEPGEPGPASQANPPPAVASRQPGSETTPAATYTYETPGSYTVTITVSWTGSYTYTRPGYAPTTSPLGTSTRSATRSYAVRSITPVVVRST